MSQCLPSNDGNLIIGYYPVRVKGQVPRLLCEYLQLPYKDLLFTPPTWENFKETQQLNWIFPELPFLKDGDFVVIQRYPICIYIVNKANRKDLLGRTLMDEIKIDIFLSQAEACSTIIQQLILAKDLPEQEKRQKLKVHFDIGPGKLLAQYEQKVIGPYYLGYISIVDFFIYEIIFLISHVFPQKIEKFPKLLSIHRQIGALPSIKKYEQSSKAIKEYCPIRFFQKWKQSFCQTGQII